MSWTNFLESLCRSREYKLSLEQSQVIMCLQEKGHQTKNDLLQTYVRSYSNIEEEAFTQRLKNIYKKFNITGSGEKLPQLHQYLTEKYIEYQNQDVVFSDMGLTDICPHFPRQIFEKKIDNVINSNNQEEKKVDILQTFAPNLNDYYEQLIQCIQHNVEVRILLAWPYSEAARLREDALKKYAHPINSDDTSIREDDISIREYVIENLETIEKIIRKCDNSNLLKVKLYDTLPSVAMYRAGNYMLVSLFLHGLLAVENFQWELTVNASDSRMIPRFQGEFELMWKISREFDPHPGRNWRNDLKILFTK